MRHGVAPLSRSHSTNRHICVHDGRVLGQVGDCFDAWDRHAEMLGERALEPGPFRIRVQA